MMMPKPPAATIAALSEVMKMAMVGLSRGGDEDWASCHGRPNSGDAVEAQEACGS
jgi:hypothetical protein